MDDDNNTRTMMMTQRQASSVEAGWRCRGSHQYKMRQVGNVGGSKNDVHRRSELSREAQPREPIVPKGRYESGQLGRHHCPKSSGRHSSRFQLLQSAGAKIPTYQRSSYRQICSLETMYKLIDEYSEKGTSGGLEQASQQQGPVLA